tara:strand:- start:854 stop:1561 length:708 start_codon:yes stop_codon:yes gene_type:complete
MSFDIWKQDRTKPYMDGISTDDKQYSEETNILGWGIYKKATDEEPEKLLFSLPYKLWVEYLSENSKAFKDLDTEIIQINCSSQRWYEMIIKWESIHGMSYPMPRGIPEINWYTIWQNKDLDPRNWPSVREGDLEFRENPWCSEEELDEIKDDIFANSKVKDELVSKGRSWPILWYTTTLVWSEEDFKQDMQKLYDLPINHITVKKAGIGPIDEWTKGESYIGMGEEWVEDITPFT